jgi:iron complex outermembrane receptor protein
MRSRFEETLSVLAIAAVAAFASPAVLAQEAGLEEVVVTARYRSESAQDVPIALSVIGSDRLDASGTSTLAQATTLAPSTLFISSNPRNTSITIRGFGSAYGLTNDGLEPGVGIYIDQVYHPRPSASTFDLVDVERVEILRGPQGTLYGKNTTAGALNVATRLPTFEPESQLEVSGGDYGFLQGKGYVSGPIKGDTIAGKISVVSTRRDGTLWNEVTRDDINETNNLAVNGQLLFEPSDGTRVRLIAEFHEQEANCCTQLFVRVGDTLRPAAREFDALAAGLGYEPPSRDPYDRVADINSGARADQKLGGLTAIADWEVAGGTLTSVSSWRFWDWRPENDRDYTGLSILTASVNPSDQRQASQEVRFASSVGEKVDYIVGAYAFHQTIDTNGLQGYGADAAYWLLNPSANAPSELLDGYESRFSADSTVDSYALFAQVNWHVTDRLTLTPGLRYTEDRKDAVYDQTAAGGLVTTDPALIALKDSIVRSQFYQVDYSDGSASGTLNAAFNVTDDIMLYGTYSAGYKSGGINLAGIPNDAAGNPSLLNALVRPEDVSHFEIGLKSQFLSRALAANVALFDTQVEDYQANVVDVGPGALRGYLANIEEVRVQGLEADLTWSPTDSFTGYFSAAWNDGEYVSFANAPCPLELVGGPAVCDLSGRPLPALSDTVLGLGGELRKQSTIFGFPGETFFGFDASYRSEWYSDASVSQHTLIDGYGLLNLRAGFRSNGPWELVLWARNVLDEDYLQFVSVQSGNSGLVIGSPGDPRTVGVTLRAKF